MYLLPTPEKVEIKSGTYKFSDEKNIPVSKKISKEMTSPESYVLTVNESGVHIEGADEAGVYYGEVTLKQILKNYKGYLPYLFISDKPRFSYRGFMIDSCRHFFTVEEIKKMIDAAAMFKFNKFHFHLTDDQGLRIESEKYPRLTEIGSVRNGSEFSRTDFNSERYAYFYTKAQLREIVEYCKERFIEVIPEVEMPGHTTAILAAFPEFSCTGKKIEPKLHGGIFDDILCAGNTDVLKFCCDIIDELCEIFPSEYFHIGGDEAPKTRWENCEKCKSKMKELGISDTEQLQGWFVNEISQHLKSKGKKAICWNESLKGGNLKDNVTVSLWMDKEGYTAKWANKGNPVIVENFSPYYVDYPYGMHPLKNCYTFNPLEIKGLDETGKKSIIGVESPIWTEYVTTFERMSYMCFPRWFAVAETGWHGTNDKNFTSFLEKTSFYCDVLKENGHNPAPKEMWSVLPHQRLTQTAKFFLNAATKDSVNNLLGRKDGEKK